jgi:hypothetical protein
VEEEKKRGPEEKIDRVEKRRREIDSDKKGKH